MVVSTINSSVQFNKTKENILKKPIIIFRGNQTSLVLQQGLNKNPKVLATPFIGYEETDSVPQLGIGIYANSDICVFYSGGALPLDNLIQAWRSVKIIERLSGITSILMSDIWATAGRGVVQMIPSIESVALLYRDPSNFSSVVEYLFNTGPESADLDFMIKTALKNNVPVNLHEVAYEIALGTITQSEYFSTLKKEKNIPDAVIEHKRKQVFEDIDLDDMMHSFHTITPIMEKVILNPDEDYLTMYEELKKILDEKTSLLLMYIYIRNTIKNLIADKSEEQAKTIIIKLMQRYKIL